MKVKLSDEYDNDFLKFYSNPYVPTNFHSMENAYIFYKDWIETTQNIVKNARKHKVDLKSIPIVQR